MGKLSIGFGETVRYWSDVVVEDGDGLFIPFFDHRRSGGIINSAVRQIVFSMQHTGIRERQPDLMDARLAVIRFPAGHEGRSIRVDFHSEADLLSYEELNGRVRTVYETWARIIDEQAGKIRRTGTSGSTPMGF